MTYQDDRKRMDELLLATLFLHRYEPMPPHRVGALRERLDYMTDEELREFVATGKRKSPPKQPTAGKSS